MKNTKLILIDGIFGSGKSTITKIVSDYLTMNNISNIYYDEEGDDNPLYLDYCEDVFGEAETRIFIEEFKEMWKSFTCKIKSEDCIYIIESSFFQNSIRSLFNNMISDNDINSYYGEILKIIKPLNPLLIYLYKKDVKESIKDIWNARGKDFKDYCIKYDGETLYSKSKKLEGDDNTTVLWSEYQSLTDRLFQDYPYKKLHIISDNSKWDDIHKRIYEALNN